MADIEKGKTDMLKHTGTDANAIRIMCANSKMRTYRLKHVRFEEI